MNTKYLLSAISLALIAAGESFRQSANECTDEVQGVLDLKPAADIPAADAPLDSNGLPWDERIHAGTKSQNQDGSWKKRKGVDDATVDAVTAELRKTYPAPTPSGQPVVAPPAPPASVAETAPPAFGGFAPPAPPTNPEYTKLCDFIAKNIGEGKALTDEWFKSGLAQHGITLADLAKNETGAANMLANLRDVLKQINVAEVV